MIDTALILAAGLGTRLAPLSSVRAKAALPVAGTSLIGRQLQWLAAAGVTRAVVNLHHLPATITPVVGHGAEFGVAVSYSWEPIVLGSAGGPRRALDLIDRERFYIVNGDTLTDLDLDALATAHDRSGALVTMAGVAARPGYNSLRVVDGPIRGGRSRRRGDGRRRRQPGPLHRRPGGRSRRLPAVDGRPPVGNGAGAVRRPGGLDA